MNDDISGSDEENSIDNEMDNEDNVMSMVDEEKQESEPRAPQVDDEALAQAIQAELNSRGQVLED